MKKSISLILKIVVALVVLALAAKAVAARLATDPASAAPPTPPPASVTVETLTPRKAPTWTEFSGRMQAVDYAEIRPEVSGRITEVRFQDGQTVQAGDILFVIDPRPFQAAVDRDKANIASAQSKLQLAKFDQQRAQSLITSHAIAQSDLDKYNDEEHGAEASLAAATAELAQAQVDLDHAYVTAPIAGRLSRVEITLGNFVQAGANAPLLTSVVSNDGIYADFEVDEQTYLKAIRASAAQGTTAASLPVQVVAQGDDHLYTGNLESFDNHIDTVSGTIRARAKFANRDGALVPGMFVTVKLGEGHDGMALLVPDRAVSSDQSKKFVFVVEAGNKVSYREVELGAQVGSSRIVEKGLSAGDRIVVDGIQHIHPADVVDPHDIGSTGQLTSSNN